MQSHARIVIVGGGVMGAGLLYHLADEGCSDVVLIEKGELTSGSTWHAAGQSPSFTGNYTLAQFHDYGNKLAPKLEAETGQYVGWHNVGGIRFATTQEELDWFKYVQGFAATIGFRLDIIGPDEIRKINPFVTTDGVLAGAWTQDDGHMDPAGICNALAKGGRDKGATIIRHNRVIDITQLPNGEWEVITEKGNIVAEMVVNAAGCFARQVSHMVGSDAPITNMEHQYLVTDPIQELIDRDEEMPVMRDPYMSGYMRQEQRSGLIGIYESVDVAEAWTPKGYPAWESDSELFQEALDRILPWVKRAMERIPIFANAGIKKIINGAIPHTTDGLPLLGPAAGLKNFWMCCGSSFGISQGAGCGKYLAQWMLHGDAEINMAGVDPRRYGSFADENYVRTKVFQDYGLTFTTPLPGEELPAGREIRTSPLHEKLKAQGCIHTEAFGWERPKWFSLNGQEEVCRFRRSNTFDAVAEECRAIRERVGVIDLTGFAKFDVSSRDADAFLNRLFANRMPAKVGGIVLAHFLSKNGRITGEATVSRLGKDQFYVLSAAVAEDRDFDHLLQGMLEGEDVQIENVTDKRANLVIAGPQSREVLSQLTQADLSSAAFPWLTAQEIEIAGIRLRALRVNYVGEMGWELHADISELETLYDAIWQAGQSAGIANVGLYAVNSLRMEKAYRGWGDELTNEVTLKDADMLRFIKYNKIDFVGREAALNQNDETIQLIYLMVEATDSDVRGNEPVFSGKQCIGITTSGAYGHTAEKSLAFAYVDPKFAKAGTVVDIMLLGERHQAEVLSEPAYDPNNDHLRA